MFETFSTMILLLPGFLALSVKRTFTGRIQEEWQRSLIGALGFNLPIILFTWVITHVSEWPENGIVILFEPFDADRIPQYLYLTLIACGIAVMLGVLTGFIGQRAFIYRFLYNYNLTQETGKIDIWNEVFTDQETMRKWVTVRLRSGLCYRGWAKYFGTSHMPGIYLSRTDECLVTRWSETNMQEETIDGPGVFIPSDHEIVAIEFWDSEEEEDLTSSSGVVP